jgi:hypothetical protein
MDAWVERELAHVEFADERLKARLGRLLGDLGDRIGGTLPMACQDWAATKAAYRFFDNPRVDEGAILGGHMAATAARFASATGTVLVLHDTTEFSFTRNTPDGVGYLSYVKGRHGTHTACGVLLHSSLVVTTNGLPLGLAAVKFWTRRTFKGTNAAKRVVNPTTVPIEEKESVRWLENLARSTQRLGDPDRCVHVGDREADIFELFHAADAARTHFLVRTAVDRLAGQGGTTVAKLMARQPIRGTHAVEVRDDHGVASSATVHVRFRRVTVHPPGRQAEAVRAALADRHPRPRAGDAGGPGADPLEAADRPPRGRPLVRGREAGLVRDALENRDLSQGSEVGLPGGAVEAPYGRAADQPAGRPVRRRVAGVLADDGEPDGPRRAARDRADGGRDRCPGPDGRWRGAGGRAVVTRDAGTTADDLPLPASYRQVGRLPGAQE